MARKSEARNWGEKKKQKLRQELSQELRRENRNETVEAVIAAKVTLARIEAKTVSILTATSGETKRRSTPSQIRRTDDPKSNNAKLERRVEVVFIDNCYSTKSRGNSGEKKRSRRQTSSWRPS